MELYTHAASSVSFGGYFKWSLVSGQIASLMQLSKDGGISIE